MYLEIAMEMKGRFIVMVFLQPKNVHTCIIVYEHYEHTPPEFVNSIQHIREGYKKQVDIKIYSMIK